MQEKNFYFLEMNTRLQVEHPVTELVTGLDLVHLQIRIAAGEKLPFRQEDIVIRGHAIECRIYAEDADNNFFPSPGKIETLLTPAGPGIRLDSGVYAGWTVPIDYDPLLAKLIGYGEDRQQAIARLARALPEYFVAGIKTNLGLFRRILADEDFQSGKIDTGYLERLLKVEGWRRGRKQREASPPLPRPCSRCWTRRHCPEQRRRPGNESVGKSGTNRRTDVARSMEDGRPAVMHGTRRDGRDARPPSILNRMIYDVTIDGTIFRLDLDLDRAPGSWRCLVDGREVQIDAVLAQPDVLSS